MLEDKQNFCERQEMKTPSPGEYGPQIHQQAPTNWQGPEWIMTGVKTRFGETDGTYWNELSSCKLTAETDRVGRASP